MGEVDEQEATFFVELFKSVNASHQKLKRIGVVIRPMSLELDYYDKLWSILRGTRSPKAVNILAEFIAEVHSCFEEEDIQFSVHNLVTTIVENINVAVEKGDREWLKRVLLITDRLIARDEDILPHSYKPKVSYIREYTVSHKEKGEEKVLRFNCMAHFYDFKKAVAEKWSIPLRRLNILNSKGHPIRLESYFKSMNENHFIAAKFEIEELPDIPSATKNCLNSQLDLFFKLLDDPHIEKMVWSIVEKLPISEELKAKITATENILEQLQQVGFYKELYELKVVLELPGEWWTQFVSTDNLRRLISNLTKVNFKTHVELEYVATLTLIIDRMLAINNQQQKNIEVPKELCESILNLLSTLLGTLQA